MKMLSYILLTVGILLISGCGGRVVKNVEYSQNNAVKKGIARLGVSFHIIRNIPDNMERNSNCLQDSILNKIDLFAGVSSIFSSEPFSSVREDTIVGRRLEKVGHNFWGNIPIECLQQIGVCQIYIDGIYHGGTIVPFSQNDTTTLDIYLSDSNKILWIDGVNSQNLTGTDLRILGEISTQAFVEDPPFRWMPIDRYKGSWKDCFKYETDSVWPRYRKESIFRNNNEYEEYKFRGADLPKRAKEWMLNDLKISFATYEILSYKKNVQVNLGKIVKDPPVSAYSFIDSIDYSPDVFLYSSVKLPQGIILKKILNIPGSGIESIGEKPVAQWQKEVRKILAPAIKEPTKLLMDLLAGMSYVLQIETGEPLSERQITNINKGFTDDIGKIVLSYNTKLAEEAKKQ